ncbi:MAG: hypothetical protein WCG27_13430 [Pseudomonadota bacterium]
MKKWIYFISIFVLFNIFAFLAFAQEDTSMPPANEDNGPPPQMTPANSDDFPPPVDDSDSSSAEDNNVYVDE